MPLALFEAMARWYFGGSSEKEPPQYRRDDNTVVVSDAWFGILCLSYFGNGPRHQSVGISGGFQGTMDVPTREEVVQYAEIRKTPQMVPGGYAAKKAQVKHGKRPDQADQGSDGPGPDHRRALRTGDEPAGLSSGDLAGGPVLHDGGPAV